MNILILGCGPAGLMATHAAALEGHKVVVVSKKRQSELFGAQYLHQPIPGMTESGPIEVNYTLQGTAQEYREKVYGTDSRVTVSPEALEENHLGWDIRTTYDNLWNEYQHRIVDGQVSANSLGRAMEEWKPDFTVSTLPAPVLCDVGEHRFDREYVWAIGDAPARGVTCPVKVPRNTVVCNGSKDVGWYRAANVFGHTTAEWPQRKKPPFGAPASVQKPTITDCTCWGAVQRLGRYGAWKKGVLSHEAFFTMQAMLRGEYPPVLASQASA